MSSLNKVFLMGNLTRDPELRYTPQGVPVSDMGLAVSREFTLQSGEKRKDTLFIDVTVWRRQAELCCQYLKKGSPIFIEGRLTMDSWDTPEGQKRTKIRVVADNFQFIGGGRGAGKDSGPSEVEEPADGPPPAAEGRRGPESRRSGDFGQGGPRFGRAPEAAAATSLPATDEADGSREERGEDVPF